MEAALVLPILLLLVFGVIEFSRAYNAQVTLTHAARVGVRELALTKDASSAEAAARAAATSIDDTALSVATTACTSGDPTEVTLTYPHAYDIPLFGTGTVTLTATGVMRCGG